MDKQIFLDLTPIDDKSGLSLYVNTNAIQAIERGDVGSIVRVEGVAYKVRESQSKIIEMMDASDGFLFI